MFAGSKKNIFAHHFLRLGPPEVAAAPGEHIFVCLFLHTDLLEVAAGPSEHICARQFLHRNLPEAAAGPGKQIFARHFLRLNLLEMAAGPANTILRVGFARRSAGSGHGPLGTHFCMSVFAPRPGGIGRVPGEHILRITFCTQTCWKRLQPPPNTFLCVRHFLRPELLEVAVGPGEHLLPHHFLRPHLLPADSTPIDFQSKWKVLWVPCRAAPRLAKSVLASLARGHSSQIWVYHRGYPRFDLV